MKENELRTLSVYNRTLVINESNKVVFSLPSNKFNSMEYKDIIEISNKICNENNKSCCDIENIDDIKISVLYIIMTNNCNLKCKFCSYGCDTIQNVYDLEDFTLDYKKFKTFISNINPRKVIFTGGEPLLNSNIYHYIKLTKLYTNALVVLQTNGYFLDKIDNKIFTLIDWVELSTSHYKIEKLKRILNILDENKVKTYATFVFNDNYKKLIEIIDLCTSMKVELKINFVSGFGSALVNDVKLCDGKSKLKVLYSIARYLLENKVNKNELENNFRNYIDFYIPCSAFGRGMTIFPDGRVYPCHSLTDSNYYLGNINEKDVNTIKNKYFNLLKERRYKRKFEIFENSKCFKCEYKEICGGYCIAKNESENFSDCIMRKFWVDLNVYTSVQSEELNDLLENYIYLYNQKFNESIKY